MKVSVVVPTYNVEKVVTRTIDSLLNQKMNKEDYEIILVDDCSKDGTLSILNEYEQKYGNIRVYQLPENSGGASKPRNFGIDKARGEYIYLLDSDDYVIPDLLIDGYTAAIDQKADIVHFRIGTDGKRKVANWYFRVEKKNIYDVDIVKDEAYRIMGGQSKMYRRDFLGQYNLRFDEEVRVGEDQLFNVEAYIHCNNLIILQEKDYVIMTVGGHDHISSTILSSEEYFDRNNKVMNLFEQLYEDVNPRFIDEFRLAYLRKIQSNKHHFKVITNVKLDFDYRKDYYVASQQFLQRYVSNSDYSAFRNRWGWITQAMRELNYESFLDLYNRVERLSRKDGVIEDNKLVVHLSKESRTVSYNMTIPIDWKNDFDYRISELKISNDNLVICGIGWYSLYQYPLDRYTLRLQAQVDSNEYYTMSPSNITENGEFIFEIPLTSLPLEKEKNALSLFINGGVNNLWMSQRLRGDKCSEKINDKVYLLENLFIGNISFHVYQSKFGYIKLSYEKK